MTLSNSDHLLFESDNRTFSVVVESTKPVCMVCVKDSVKKGNGLETHTIEKTYSLEEVMELLKSPSEIFPKHIAGNTICLKEIKTFLQEALPPIPSPKNMLPLDAAGC